MNEKPAEEGVQITGLEILTDDKPQAPPAAAALPKKAKGPLTPKKAPAFIRGGKKPIVRTRSLPRSFQRPGVPDQAKNVQLSPARRPKPRAMMRVTSTGSALGPSLKVPSNLISVSNIVHTKKQPYH